MPHPPEHERRRGAVAPAAVRETHGAPLQQSMVDHPDATVLGALFLLAVIGLADRLTGTDLAFSQFYLVPVTAVAWSNSRRIWVAISVLSAITWLLADTSAGARYSSWAVPAWNTTMRFAVFALVGALFEQLHRSVVSEQRRSSVDFLTGVLNTREFMRRGAELIEQPGRGQLTVMFVDLDDFKVVNDTKGHGGGDQVLRDVGHALRGSVREQDVVGRLGGDEFALIFMLGSGTPADAAVDELVARVRDTLAGLEPSIGFSAGAVTFAVPPASLESALEEADRLMYEAKRSGKGSVVHRTSSSGAGGPGR